MSTYYLTLVLLMRGICIACLISYKENVALLNLLLRFRAGIVYYSYSQRIT